MAIFSSNKTNVRAELDSCFGSFNPKTTHRGEFASKIFAILLKHTNEIQLDSNIVYESISLSKKDSLSFIQSLIGDLAMTKRSKLALRIAEKVSKSFPELLTEKIPYSKSLH